MTNRPILLCETGMPVRYYFPREDVKNDYLVHSETKSICPYKGFAKYFSVRVDRKTFEDVIWYYDQPFDTASKLKGYLAFWEEKIDKIVLES